MILCFSDMRTKESETTPSQEERRELEKESVDMLKKVEEFSSERNILSLISLSFYA